MLARLRKRCKNLFSTTEFIGTMRNFLFITLLLLSGLCTAQNTTYTFSPKWKPGAQRTLRIHTNSVSEKNGVKEPEEDETLQVEVEVTREDRSFYYLNINYENVVLRTVKKFFADLGEEAQTKKKLLLKYKVNKETGDLALINWKDAQQFILSEIDQMTSLVKKKSPETADMAALAFSPIKLAFKDQQSIEAYISDEIGFLTLPFGKNLSTVDTLTITDRVPNPFNPQDSINGTSKFILKSITGSACVINSQQQLDLSSFKQMMKELMKTLAKSFNAADTEKKLAELDQIEFDIRMSDDVFFDRTSSWPTKYVRTGTFTMSDGEKSNHSVTTKTVTVE